MNNIRVQPTINNLSHREKTLARIIWNIDTKSRLMQFTRSLPYEDQLTIAGLTEMIIAGGDDVAEMSQAQIEIDRIRRL
jgi:hypothetical protein